MPGISEPWVSLQALVRGWGHLDLPARLGHPQKTLYFRDLLGADKENYMPTNPLDPTSTPEDPFDGADPKLLPLLKRIDRLRKRAPRLKKLGVTNFVVKDPTTGDDGL